MTSKKHKVVMLPTEESNIILWEIRGELDYYSDKQKYKEGKSAIPQHLYLTSDEEIREGDWVYNSSRNFGKRIYKCQRVRENNEGFPYKVSNPIKGDEAMYLSNKTFKVIATTDPKLTKVDEVSGDNVWTSPIPQVPQSLIEYYAKHQPEYVELEYEMNGEYDGGCTAIWKQLKLVNNDVVWVEHRTMSIVDYMNKQHEVGKLYSREEVEELCRSAHRSGKAVGENIESYSWDEIEKWLKENL